MIEQKNNKMIERLWVRNDKRQQINKVLFKQRLEFIGWRNSVYIEQWASSSQTQKMANVSAIRIFNVHPSRQRRILTEEDCHRSDRWKGRPNRSSSLRSCQKPASFTNDGSNGQKYANMPSLIDNYFQLHSYKCIDWFTNEFYGWGRWVRYIWKIRHIESADSL